jgi:hypothetical protein
VRALLKGETVMKWTSILLIVAVIVAFKIAENKLGVVKSFESLVGAA